MMRQLGTRYSGDRADALKMRQRRAESYFGALLAGVATQRIQPCVSICDCGPIRLAERQFICLFKNLHSRVKVAIVTMGESHANIGADIIRVQFHGTLKLPKCIAYFPTLKQLIPV